MEINSHFYLCTTDLAVLKTLEFHSFISAAGLLFLLTVSDCIGV